MNSVSQFSVERLKYYSQDDAVEIGQLMPDLSDKLDDGPIDERLLHEIIASPHHEQIVVRDADGSIVGAATLSILLNVAVGRTGFLDAFVTAADQRGQGVGQLLWDEIIRWCEERNIDLEFTSRATREAAHRFYTKNGAVIRDTQVFQKKIKK